MTCTHKRARLSIIGMDNNNIIGKWWTGGKGRGLNLAQRTARCQVRDRRRTCVFVFTVSIIIYYTWGVGGRRGNIDSGGGGGSASLLLLLLLLIMLGIIIVIITRNARLTPSPSPL